MSREEQMDTAAKIVAQMDQADLQEALQEETVEPAGPLDGALETQLTNASPDRDGQYRTIPLQLQEGLVANEDIDPMEQTV